MDLESILYLIIPLFSLVKILQKQKKIELIINEKFKLLLNKIENLEQIIIKKEQSQVNENFEFLFNKIENIEQTILRIEQSTLNNIQESIANSEKEIEEDSTIIHEKDNILESIPEEEITQDNLENTETISKQEIEQEQIEILEKSEPIRTINPPIKTSNSFDLNMIWNSFKEKNPDLEKFIGENIISKIGILILVLGISFFVKYAIDQNWINEIARVGIGILSGVIVLGFAHYLRKEFKAFSSILVAGSLAIFYFTIGIAYHEYLIFTQTIAFILMVIITIFSVGFTLLYNRKELGVLSLIGGFSVPFMVSSGEGNHVVLFSYILILNLGMILLSFYKNWNIIKILAFAFTQLIFASWLIKLQYDDFKPYKDALLFASMYYILFFVMNMIYKLRVKSEYSVTEIVLILINNFIFYIEVMLILHEIYPEYKGVFTLIIAVINFILAKILINKNKADKNTLYVLIGSVLVFITLIAPVQLKGNYITIFWAVEALLLVWLYEKSKIKGFLNASLIIHCLMLLSLLLDLDYYEGDDYEMSYIVFNISFITSLFSAISLFMSYFILKNNKENIFKIPLEEYTKYLLISSGILLYFTGFLEVLYKSDLYFISYYSSSSCLFLYHLLAMSVFFRITEKIKKDNLIKTAVIFGYGTILLYIFVIVYDPINSFTFQLLEKQELKENIAYILNYFILGFLGYIFYKLYKIQQNNSYYLFFLSHWITRIFIFLVVYILSIQVVFHGILIKQSKILNYDIYQNILTEFYKSLLAITWGVLSLFFLYLGIKKSWKTVRVSALILLLITLVKLFVYDIKDVSEAGKIIAFILLGVLILVMSFMYQKIKKVLLDEKK